MPILLVPQHLVPPASPKIPPATGGWILDDEEEMEEDIEEDPEEEEMEENPEEDPNEEEMKDDDEEEVQMDDDKEDRSEIIDP